MTEGTLCFKTMTDDSPSYINKKHFYDRVLTIYGRKPALEALQIPDVKAHRLHLSESNKPAEILSQIIDYAEQKGAETIYHSRQSLSRISKNSKQDQGVAVDLILPKFKRFEDLDIQSIVKNNEQFIALDKVTNPQNLGMIIRSVCASPLTGLILPKKGCAKLDSLVIKASAGTLFKTQIIRAENLSENLSKLKEYGIDLIGLDAKAKESFGDFICSTSAVYILGNETEGLSTEIQQLCHRKVKIPMQNGVESLNVAVTASLIAFQNLIKN